MEDRDWKDICGQVIKFTPPELIKRDLAARPSREHPMTSRLLDIRRKLVDGQSGIWKAAFMHFNRRVEYDMSYGEKEQWCHDRGGRPYFSPSGYRRYSFFPTVDSPAEEEEIMKDWHVAYHGTKGINVDNIVAHGLVPPGSTVGGVKIKVLHGNAGAKGSKPIYLSPSIEYSSHWLYTRPEQVQDEWVYYIFQVRVRPGSFKEQQNTLHKSIWGEGKDSRFSCTTSSSGRTSSSGW
jgi:hypothetical protein